MFIIIVDCRIGGVGYRVGYESYYEACVYVNNYVDCRIVGVGYKKSKN